MTNRISLKHPARGIATAAGIAALCLLPASVAAQAPGTGFATSYSANASKPVDIEADTLEVDDKKKTAVFRGNVSATQGDVNLKSREVYVTYTGSEKKTASAAPAQAAASPLGGGGEITQIDAKGKVLITNKNEMTATSEWAMFDVPKQEVTLGGDVVMTQGSNTIKGEKLIVDLKTGVARVDPGSNVAANGEKVRERVRLIFTPKSREKEGEKKN